MNAHQREEQEYRDYWHGRSYESHTIDCQRWHYTEKEPEACHCRGTGWFLSSYDTHEKCFAHYKGQQHPEDAAYEDSFRFDSFEDYKASALYLYDTEILMGV